MKPYKDDAQHTVLKASARTPKRENNEAETLKPEAYGGFGFS